MTFRVALSFYTHFRNFSISNWLAWGHQCPRAIAAAYSLSYKTMTGFSCVYRLPAATVPAIATLARSKLKRDRELGLHHTIMGMVETSPILMYVCLYKISALLSNDLWPRISWFYFWKIRRLSDEIGKVTFILTFLKWISHTWLIRLIGIKEAFIVAERNRRQTYVWRLTVPKKIK